jgi:uncharacterized paraquat-inducible protein A
MYVFDATRLCILFSVFFHKQPFFVLRTCLLLANHKIFHISRYGSCLGYLEKLKSNLLLDIHLHEHLEVLYKDIRHKAIIQYTFPFISVDLNTMAVAFKTTVSLLEKELAALITDNKIQVPYKDALHRQRSSVKLPSIVLCLKLHFSLIKSSLYINIKVHFRLRRS